MPEYVVNVDIYFDAADYEHAEAMLAKIEQALEEITDDVIAQRPEVL